MCPFVSKNLKLGGKDGEICVVRKQMIGISVASFMHGGRRVGGRQSSRGSVDGMNQKYRLEMG
jgi:hypothetical protein